MRSLFGGNEGACRIAALGRVTPLRRSQQEERGLTIKIEQPTVAANSKLGYVSDVAAEMLRRLGLRYVVQNPGSSFAGLHDSLVNYLGNKDPTMMLALNEQVAVAIAHGYAKVTDEPMGVIMHSNVGLMNGIMGIYNAWVDRVPVYMMGASGPHDATQRTPWIHWIHNARDQAAMIRHFIKWDDSPGSAGALIESMLRANILGRTPPCGPTYICLDVAMQQRALDGELRLPDAGALCAAGAARAAGAGDRARCRPSARRQESGDHGRPRLAQPGRLGPPREARRDARRLRRHRREDRRSVSDRPRPALRHPRRAFPDSAEGAGAQVRRRAGARLDGPRRHPQLRLRRRRGRGEDHPLPGRFLRPQRLEHGPPRAGAGRRADPRRPRPLRGEAAGCGRAAAQRQAALGRQAALERAGRPAPRRTATPIRRSIWRR